MFSKKYTFESKETKLRRILLNLFLVLILTFAFLSLFGLYIPIHANQQAVKAQEYFFQKNPDVIAVFTGDKGRIKVGIELSQKYPDAKFFISGVDSRNSFKTILEYQRIDADQKNLEELIEEKSINLEIDYLSRNTLENVLSTIRFLRQNPHLKDVLIVSSDYHIFRINLFLMKIKNNKDNFNFHFHSIPNKYTKTRNIKLLGREIIKILKAVMVIIFWDN
jgi:uncharacterized SAM-binding protein YcdF (DUF218 family)